MSGDLYAELKEELQSVHNMIRSQLTIKAGHVGDYAHLEFAPGEHFIRPALVLAVARLYNCMSARVLSLGAVVQFIFMASQIHSRIPETSESGADSLDPRDGTQFPVLVGDYLYGKFFTTLCDANIVTYLGTLAEIIARIHEGGILNRTNPNAGKENPELFYEIIRLETAELMAGAARLAGDLAGAPEREQLYLYDFGFGLGMICGLTQKGIYDHRLINYSDKAMKALEKLPNHPERGMLEKLLRSLCSTEAASIRKVV